MFIRYALSIIAFSYLFSNQANAQAAATFERIGFDPDVEIFSYLNGFSAYNVFDDEMNDQLRNKGCIPRGELLSNKFGGFGYYDQTGSINRKNSELRIRFTLCDDNLSPLVPYRNGIRLSMGFYEYNRNTVNKKTAPKVSFKGPSGQEIPLSSMCGVHNTVKLCVVTSRPSFSQEDQHNDVIPLTEAGTYEIIVKNPGYSDFLQTMKVHTWTSKITD